MQDLVATKIFCDESTDRIIEVQWCGDPMDIMHYEEYKGDVLDNYGPITALTLYTGERLCIKKSFRDTHTKIQELKTLRRRDAFLYKVN